MLSSVRLFFALVSFGIAIAAGDAHAANELCGQTITQSVTLTADQACTGDGLVVVGDGITIDLGGFTLSGDGDPGNDGVDVTGAGSGSVVIKNGTIRNFRVGIATHGMAPKLVKVSKVALRGNVDSGLDVTADQIVIDKSAVTGNGFGLRTTGTTVKINATTVAGSISGGINVRANTLTVTKALVMGNGGRGFELSLGGSKVVIKSSQFLRNGDIGLLIAEATTTPGAILIAKNRVIGNGSTGVSLSGGDDASHLVPVTVSGNLITGNAGHGVLVGSESDDTVVAGNRVVGNAAGGVAVASSAARVLVKGNTIVGNDIAGIGTESTDATLAKNVLNANDVAILAPFGAIDGGGNKARGNLDDSCSASIACPPRFVPKPGPVIPVCGMQVTSSIVLGADTPMCPGDGLVISASDVTINLNGHQLRGNGTPGKSGIKTSAPVHQRVAIINGSVRGFATGIDALAGGITVVNVEVRGNGNEGAVLGGDNLVVDKSEFVGNGGRGLTLNAANPPFGAKVKASLFVGNEGGGLLTNGGSAVVTSVVATGNGGVGVFFVTAGTGQLTKSLAAANAGTGVRIADAFGVLAPVTIKKNEAFGNWGDGFLVASSAVGAVVDGNLSAGNAGRGVALTSNPAGTTVAKNDLVGNGSNGLFVDVSVGPTAIVQNKAIGNGTAGVSVGIATATLTKNSAVGNQLSGIQTPFGAIDGGGNTARDNVNDPQCTAPIVCP